MSAPLSPSTLQPSVLIVDDDIDLAGLLSRLLARKGMTALTAASGSQCLELMRRHPGIDVIVMDLMMPDMDGLQVCAALRQMEIAREVPVILLTARDEAAARRASKDLGVSAFLLKPISAQDLFACIQMQISPL